MTINQYISDIRQLIKENGRDDNTYTDPFLYSLLNGARNTLLEQNANKSNKLSEWDWQQFPIKLVKDKSHMIGCVTVGCDILRSECKIPRPILGNKTSLFKVRTFDYTTISFGSEKDFQFNKYDDIKSKLINSSIINDYLVIWNNLNLKMVLGNGIWENILDWATIPQCDDSGEYSVIPCFDAKTSDFNMSLTLKQAAEQMVLKQLGITLQLKEDITNDTNSEIRI